MNENSNVSPINQECAKVLGQQIIIKMKSEEEAAGESAVEIQRTQH